MFKLASIALVAAALSSSVSAYTLHFHNNCPYTVWSAVGAAPYGQPNPDISFGARVDPGGDAYYEADYNVEGLRSWGRTGESYMIDARVGLQNKTLVPDRHLIFHLKFSLNSQVVMILDPTVVSREDKVATLNRCRRTAARDF